MSTAPSEAGWGTVSPSTRRRTLDLERLRESAPLTGLLVLTAVLYLWSLSRNGWANQYYAAAVQAGTHSWKAFVFGSFDAANYITVDKTPASLWLMELSTRIFGFSSFSMLLPQALEGVAAVALLYAIVRRWFGRPAALLSGLILALTPVAALMFRFNNPDALLVLLFLAAAYALTRALESGATRWLVLAGTAVGFAFLTKELQALLVVPGFAMAYLVAGPVRLRRRIWQLLVAGAALVASAGWWVALVQLWPSSARPYFGDSTTNSILQVIFGSNGLDRISAGGLGGGPGGGFSGSAGVLRLFNSELGGQIAWLLPGAVILLVAGLVWTARRPRTDRTRAALLVWGGWLVVTAVVFSFMTGVIHPYYASSLAPPIAALGGVGAVILWRHRDLPAPRLLLCATLAVTVVVSFSLLDRTPGWHPWIRYAVLIGGLAAAAGLLAAGHVPGRIRSVAGTVALVAALAGPAAYTLSTVSTVQAGGNPLAGPAMASASRFPGGPPGDGARISPALAGALEHGSRSYTWVAATSSTQNGASLELATDTSVMAIGGFGGSDPAITLARFKRLAAEHRIHYYVAGGQFGPGSAGRLTPRTGLPGGSAPPGGGSAPPGPGPLPQNPPGSPMPAAGGRSGFSLAGPPGPGSPDQGHSVASEIESWVTKHFRSSTVGGTTLYDLTQPKTAR